MLTYEHFYYCYKFENKIFSYNYKNLKIKGFKPIKSVFVEYSNQFLKIVILTTQLEIISKIPITNDILNNILTQFKLPTVTLQWKRVNMIKYYKSLTHKQWIHKRFNYHYGKGYNEKCKIVLYI